MVENLEHIKDKYILTSCSSINVYTGDESRFGLFTVLRKVLTAKGTKPIAPYQHKFDNIYLFGAFSPINGDNFLLEMPVCNSQTFQLFLDNFSLEKPDEFKILILDNGAFHKAQSLIIPENIAIIFLPPYSPELNPAEKMWRFIKDRISMTVHKDLKELKKHLTQIITKEITDDIVKSICGYEFYKSAYKCTFNV